MSRPNLSKSRPHVDCGHMFAGFTSLNPSKDTTLLYLDSGSVAVSLDILTPLPQVLFCRLTSYQRRLYSEFLASTEVKSVLSRTMRAFRAIGILRKLCNHPDLVCRFGDSVVTRCVPMNAERKVQSWKNLGRWKFKACLDSVPLICQRLYRTRGTRPLCFPTRSVKTNWYIKLSNTVHLRLFVLE